MLIITLIRARRIWWAGHVACIGQMRNAYKSYGQNLHEGDHLGELDVNEWIML